MKHSSKSAPGAQIFEAFVKICSRSPNRETFVKICFRSPNPRNVRQIWLQKPKSSKHSSKPGPQWGAVKGPPPPAHPLGLPQININILFYYTSILLQIKILILLQTSQTWTETLIVDYSPLSSAMLRTAQAPALLCSGSSSALLCFLTEFHTPRGRRIIGGLVGYI